MPQTHKETLRERRSKRREYLLNEATGSVVAFFCFLLSAGFALAAIGSMLILLTCGLLIRGWPVSGALTALLCTVFCGAISALAFRSFDRTIERLKTLHHVPPVAEQIAALPAEEILVRGSAQPVASPDELLRAAGSGLESGSQELLWPLHDVITQIEP